MARPSERDGGASAVDRPLLERDQRDRAVEYRLTLAQRRRCDRTMTGAGIAPGAEALQVAPAIATRSAPAGRNALDQPPARIGVERGQLHVEELGRLPGAQELGAGATAALPRLARRSTLRGMHLGFGHGAPHSISEDPAASGASG